MAWSTDPYRSSALTDEPHPAGPDHANHAQPHQSDEAQIPSVQPMSQANVDGVDRKSAEPLDVDSHDHIGIPGVTEKKLNNFVDLFYKHANRPATIGD